MTRSAVRICLFFLSTALLTGFFVSDARADGPTLSAVFGIAGHYRPGGWCPITVTVRNPGTEAISGQLQILTADAGSHSAYRQPARSESSSVTVACPVTVPAGFSPHAFTLYLRGIDPGQADLTVQLVDGRERGDGPILAKINTLDSNTTRAFTGGPVGVSDRLLVGFGSDPSAFTVLNGRRLGGQSASDAAAGTPPVTLQVAGASAADLPDKAGGYAGVDAFLLRSDAPLDALTEAQADALKGWVASGGHLVVFGGGDPLRFSDPFFQGVLPAAVGPANSFGTLGLTPKPLPGVRVLSVSPQGTPLIVSGPFGAGSVTLTAIDAAGSAFQEAGPQTALSSIWQALLFSRDRNASALPLISAREENYGVSIYGSPSPLLSDTVMRGPSLAAPAASIIGAFLIVYLIVLVPLNYLILKRLDRREWAWATIPVLVLVFAAGTYGVGYAAKGGSVFINRASLIETSAGRREAGVYGEIGLFSPHRSSYDISLPGSNLMAAIPNPGQSYGRRSSSNEREAAGPVKFVQTASGATLPETPINMWAMRAIDTQATTNLGGTIDGAFTQTNAVTVGTIENNTPYTLTDCSVWVAGRWNSLGTLSPGAKSAVRMTGSGNASLFDVPSLTRRAPGAAPSDIQEQMRAALANYLRSLSEPTPNLSGGLSTADTPFPGEALLVGWSDEAKLAGPSPKIDGRMVTENDVSLVIVHLPAAPTLSRVP